MKKSVRENLTDFFMNICNQYDYSLEKHWPKEYLNIIDFIQNSFLNYNICLLLVFV